MFHLYICFALTQVVCSFFKYGQIPFNYGL